MSIRVRAVVLRRWGLQFWPAAVVMMFIATMTAALETSSGRSAWFVGVPVLTVCFVFAMTRYLLPQSGT